MGKLEVKIEPKGDSAEVKLSGVIDEDIDFSTHSLTNYRHLKFDLNDVKTINSCGIREWIKWLGTASGSQIQLYKCPKVIIDQVNMVQGFLPANGQVESFYVPYFAEESGSEKNVLFESGQHYKDGQITPPAEVKDDEGNPMEMDVIESKYFKFLKTIK